MRSINNKIGKPVSGTVIIVSRLYIITLHYGHLYRISGAFASGKNSDSRKQ
ncbi:hypothetical protein J2X14_000073 [Pantoea alhagi]|uniref:hypothetical protein n=1 Tax=Mixta sp. BE291 TaxID=3158787 RepID=UPI00285F286A|nr:hypothetical protein [Pantoea alhagi]